MSISQRAALGRTGLLRPFSIQELPLLTAAATQGGFPELDCLRERYPAHVLADAERRAQHVGTGADRVLIASCAMSEEEYVRALAERLSVPFDELTDATRADCLLSDADMIAKAAGGMLSVASDEEPAIVIAPRRFAARQLSLMLSADPSLRKQWRFTTSERLNGFILRCSGALLAKQAADGLHRRSPELCARPTGKRLRWCMATVFVIAAAWFVPRFAIGALELFLGCLFLGWLGLRLAGTVLPARMPAALPQMSDDTLPVYTVVAALYREAASVDELLHAIARLDYPREKLDVIMAVEAEDKETRTAIANSTARVPVTVVVIPAGKLRTKPRALNAALPFAQGALTVIYDAEDRPDPDQLRRALHAFARGGEKLACVQARLTIDNTADSWLTGLFTAEYAGHFDVFLDGMAALLLPLPLGGSSNHFRGLR